MWPDDQIVFSIFGHLQQWNLPESIQIVTTRVKNFAQTQINLKYIAKYFYIFAKAVEFRQIWSHWRRTSLECLVFQNRPINFLSFKSNTFSLDGLPVSMHRKSKRGGRHSSVDSSGPSILRSQVQIPSIPSTNAFLILIKFYTIFVIGWRKEWKQTKKLPSLAII